MFEHVYPPFSFLLDHSAVSAVNNLLSLIEFIKVCLWRKDIWVTNDLVILQRDCAICRFVSLPPYWATAFQLGTAVCDQGNLLPGLPAGLFLLWASRIRDVSQDAAWHTQSEGEAMKVIISPQTLYSQASAMSQNREKTSKQTIKNRKEWRVFWGLIKRIFFNLSSQERIACICLSQFFF